MNGFYITVKNGLLEPKHLKAMHGDKDSGAIWLFLWLLDKMTIIDHEKGEGKVLGGKPVRFEDISPVLTVHRVTYQRWLKILRDGGYIQTTRTPYGLVIVVNKAFKVFGQKSKEADVAQPLHLSENGDNRYQADPATSLHARPATSNKTIQRQYSNNIIMEVRAKIKEVVTSNLRNGNKHELIKSLLVAEAKNYNLTAIPEFYPYPGSKHRIDCVWLKGEQPVIGFEIDQTVYPKSIKKLEDLGCVSVIITFGNNYEKIELKKQLLPTNFYHIYFYNRTQKLFSTLEDITPEVVEEIARDYKVPVGFAKTQFEKMKNWLEAKGKTYKNYKAGLRNWVLSEAEKAGYSTTKVKEAKEPEFTMSPEERAKGREKIEQLRREKFGESQVA
jgi:hypothetical protein